MRLCVCAHAGGEGGGVGYFHPRVGDDKILSPVIQNAVP